MYAVYVKMSRDFHGGEFHGDFHGTRRTGPFRLRGVPEVRYLLPVPYVMRRGRETDGLDDSLHGPVPHAGAQGNGPPTFPVRGRAGPARSRSATAASRPPRPPAPPAGDRDARRILGLALRLRRGSMAGGSEEDVFRSDGGGRKRGGRHLRRKRLRRGAGPSPPPPRGRRVEATGVLL